MNYPGYLPEPLIRLPRRSGSFRPGCSVLYLSYPPEGNLLLLGENILRIKLWKVYLELSNLSDLEASMMYFDTKIPQIVENLPLGGK